MNQSSEYIFSSSAETTYKAYDIFSNGTEQFFGIKFQEILQQSNWTFESLDANINTLFSAA
jgi:hypothetical protein